MSAESILAKQGITLQQAVNFINGNIEQKQPKLIFDAAYDHAVTTSMLNEITGHAIDAIDAYFTSNGYDSSKLNDIGKLFNSDLGDLDLGGLKILVAFNEEEVFLNKSLHEEVIKKLNENEVNKEILEEFDTHFFAPTFSFQERTDYIYDPEELGVKDLGNIAAIVENIESIFYGTLINIFKNLDATELEQIVKFPGDQNSEAYRTLLQTSLTTISSTAWTDVELANLVVDEAARIVIASDMFNEKFDIHTLDNVGILDSSFLGLSVL